MKKLCLVAAAIFLIAFWGCAQNGSGGSVTLTVVSPFDEADGNRANFVSAYKAYEETSGNSVKDESASLNEERKAKIKEDFQRGKEPDILFYFVGADADELIQAGKLVSLDEIRRDFPEYASNMKGSMMPVSTANGRQYAVPVNGYWESLFVNKNVLAACGVEMPGPDYTWEAFLRDCEIIRTKGYTPIACSLSEIPHYWFEYAVFNHGSIASHASLPENSGDAAGQNWTAGLLDIKDLYERGFFPDNTNTAPDSETAMLILEDKAAFMLDGSWKIGWFQEKADTVDNFAVTYVPAQGERKATDIVSGISMGYYITKKAWDDPKKRDACVAFVTAMTTDEVVSSFGVLSVTALKSGTVPPEDADALVMSALAMTKGCTGAVPAAQDLLNLDARKALFDEVPKIVTGTNTPEAAIDSCLATQ